MDYTLLVVDEKLGETIIEGHVSQAGVISILEKYTQLDDLGKLHFANDLGGQGSAEHSGVWYSVYVTGGIGTMVRSLGDKSS
ncbi:hypothetical protein SEA_ALAINAMARIE_80 [Gordonia phage AlainaMarie]|nr:hypothetical protein SEA_ALAINAMARIE_80 [Gordonia phage AlainaMarie]